MLLLDRKAFRYQGFSFHKWERRKYLGGVPVKGSLKGFM
jgi:hypothetical protein